MGIVSNLPMDDYADLLDYMKRRARFAYRRLLGRIPVEELEDGGMASLEKALATWDPARRGKSFHVPAKVCVNFAIPDAARAYTRWRQPTPSRERWLPPAEYVRPAVAHDPATTVMQEAMLTWLEKTLAAHRGCLSPTARQALDDFLADLSLEAIATRDGVPTEQPRSARRLMLTTLRRHLGLQQTTCAEEQARWVSHGRGSPRSREVSYAAAD